MKVGQPAARPATGGGRQRTWAALRMALVAAWLSMALLPAPAYADPCDQGEHERNPHCSAPEVPAAAIFPLLGVASFAVTQAIRARRRPTRKTERPPHAGAP